MFSREPELNFVTAFNNSVMAEGLSTSFRFNLIDFANDHQSQDLRLLLPIVRKPTSSAPSHMSSGRHYMAYSPVQTSSPTPS